jgi:hypothetical protein
LTNSQISALNGTDASGEIFFWIYDTHCPIGIWHIRCCCSGISFAVGDRIHNRKGTSFLRHFVIKRLGRSMKFHAIMQPTGSDQQYRPHKIKTMYIQKVICLFILHVIVNLVFLRVWKPFHSNCACIYHISYFLLQFDTESLPTVALKPPV